MLSLVKSMTVNGINAYLVSVQVDVSNGLPYFEIVGLPDTIVKEAKERVRVAIKNSGYNFFNKRIIINLAPANTKKGGAIFDLPIAIGMLSSFQLIKNDKFNDYIIVGELSLDGKIKKIEGALAICMEMRKIGIKNIILPKENEKEVSIIEKINIYPASTLVQVIEHLNDINSIKTNTVVSYKSLLKKEVYDLDFSDVYGQENVKRVLEISAAGGHNVLMTGNPGSGKTMLAQRLPTILPYLNFEEALAVTKIHSIYSDEEEKNKIYIKRPFRAPHYTISEKALIGGGEVPKPRRSYISKLWSAIFR